MKQANKIISLVFAVLLAATIYGLFRTREEAGPPPGYASAGAPALSQDTEVDQSPLLTAQTLVRLPTTPDEQPSAQAALGIADQEMDLAFAMALADATEHPPALSADAKQIQARLQSAEDGLAAQQAQVTQLTAAEAKAGPAQKDAIDNQLALAKATLELRQDQVDDAKEDLIRAGGDPQDRIQRMVDEHDAASKSSDSTMVDLVAEPEPSGLVQRAERWWALHQKQMQLWQAKQDAASLAAQFSTRHESLESQTAAQENKFRGAAPAGSGSAAAADNAKAAAPSPEDSAAQVAATKRRSANSRAMASLDKRVANEQQLANVYGQWISIVAAQQRVQVNRGLRGALIILAIALIGLFVDGWIESLVSKTHMDRRQLATLRSTTRVSLQIVAILLVLVVIFGPPTQLGTVLGLVGAGLTIALQAFPVAFVGWLILMGRGGIRVGDWVQINGVTGEVVDLGMFRTVLLETGTDSGYPTGRRVTFPNTYAVQGFYFNFSTSGQWMWDELQVVLPGNQNPYPLAEALRNKVTEETSEIVRQAEQEWRSSARSHDLGKLSAVPSVYVKPVAGGAQITVRYITSAHRRSELHAKLNQDAIALLGLGQPEPKVAAAPKPALTTN